jgi:flotillin
MFPTAFQIEISDRSLLLIAVGAMMLAVLAFAAIFASRFARVGPNQVLIVSGRKRLVTLSNGTTRAVGFRVVKGGGTFVFPIFERVDVLSLELRELRSRWHDLRSRDGVPLQVECAAQFKIGGDDARLELAAERYLTSNPDQIKQVAGTIIEAELRGLLASTTADEAVNGLAKLTARAREAAARSLAGAGLELANFSLPAIAPAVTVAA